jgi:hypothetical protein
VFHPPSVESSIVRPSLSPIRRDHRGDRRDDDEDPGEEGRRDRGADRAPGAATDRGEQSVRAATGSGEVAGEAARRAEAPDRFTLSRRRVVAPLDEVRDLVVDVRRELLHDPVANVGRERQGRCQVGEEALALGHQPARVATAVTSDANDSHSSRDAASCAVPRGVIR